MKRITYGIIMLAAMFAGTASAGLISDWGQRYGDEGTVNYRFQRISAVDTDDAGNIYIAGEFQGQINLGGSTFFSNVPNKYDIFVAKYSPSGAHLWSDAGGGIDNDIVYDIDAAFSGGVAVAGETSSPVFTMAGVSDSTNGQSDAFAMQFGSTGTHAWTQIMGGPFQDRAHSIAWRTGTNSVIVSGLFRGTVDFGPGPPHTSAGLADFFLADIKVWGAMFAAGTLGSTGDEKWSSICIDDNNDIVFAGTFENTVNFGNGALTSIGDQAACLAKIPSVGSAATWSQAFNCNTATDECWGVSVATDGTNFYMTGFFTGSADLGTGTLTSAGGSDVFVSAYKSGGTPVWAVSGGSTLSDFGNHIDYYDSRLSVAGLVQGTGTFGSKQATSAGFYDALLLVYDWDGNIEYAKSGGGTEYDEGAQSAFNQNGICMVGSFNETADFGSVQLVSSSPTAADAYVVQYVENSSVGVEGAIVPDLSGLSLGAPQPNPFRDAVIIEYGTAHSAGILSAEVYDVTGRLVRQLNREGSVQAGLLRWDGRNDRGAQVSPGVYFVRATDGNATTGRRVTVLR